VVCFNLKIYMG